MDEITDRGLPMFLDRRFNGITTDKLNGHRYMKKDGIVWPAARKVQPVEKALNDLTPGEQEDLMEIKLMAKTNVDLAKRMATEWIHRTTHRPTQARRRSWLRTVKGLHR